MITYNLVLDYETIQWIAKCTEDNVFKHLKAMQNAEWIDDFEENSPEAKKAMRCHCVWEENIRRLDLHELITEIKPSSEIWLEDNKKEGDEHEQGTLFEQES